MNFTQDQKNAIQAVETMVFEGHRYLVIDGSAGTGKSTLIKEIIRKLGKEWIAAAKLIDMQLPHIALTATTNKAADNLFISTRKETKTIHSFLGLRLQNGKMYYPEKPHKIFNNTLLFIDEYSYVDIDLLAYITRAIGKNSHVVFLGDHCQLSPVNARSIPVVDRNWPTVYLKEQVRQETSTLKTIAEKLKKYVSDGEFPELTPDGVSFIHYEEKDEDAFIDALIQSFKDGSSRFISYTNERTVDVSKFLFEEFKGRAEYEAGDYVTNNRHHTGYSTSIKTDASVHLIHVEPGKQTLYNRDRSESITVEGQLVNTAYTSGLFIPNDYTLFNSINPDELDIQSRAKFEKEWVDFRPQYACTVHKSQGSTYDQVFIDLTDFSKIYKEDVLARLLYVAMSRARKKIHVIGHL